VQYFDDGDANLQEQVDELTAQQSELNGLVDATSADLATAHAQNAMLATQATTAQAEVRDLDNLLGATSADLATAYSVLATAQTDAADLSNLLGATSADLATAYSMLATAQTDVAEISAERDALLGLFPLIVDTSLTGVDVTGTYRVAWRPAYNSGLADIVLPNVSQVVIGTTPEGWLEVTLPGVLTADLTRTDGALFTMVDTTTVVPPVNGVDRVARVAITIYAGETVTAQDGTTTVTDLGMSVAVSTAATAGAPAGVALYGADLTPQS